MDRDAAPEYVDGELVPPLEYPPPELPLPVPAPEPLRLGPDMRLARVPLERIAVARSGDKGLGANIGVRARLPELLPVVRHQVTPARVLAHLRATGVPEPDEGHTTVERFDWPGLHAINLVLHNVLGSLHLDRQGKSFAQRLLVMLVDVPVDMLQLVPPQPSRL